ncbi:MAG: putative DNA-binding transcriptional regulator YafY [Polaribacter sp.]|jgi:predicted DNA-binding transcriptional regulator YafY
MEKFMEKFTNRIKVYLEQEQLKNSTVETSAISKRQQLILNKLRRGNFTFKEIESYLALESDIQGVNLWISKRTLQRDLISIAEIYGVEIKYDRSIGKYTIIEDLQSVTQQKLLETVDMYHALQLKDKISDKLIFEQRQPKGTQHLVTILKAINDKKQIKFQYLKYWEDQEEVRTIEPRFLKEYKQRWYVVGIDIQKEQPRIFGLDRIQNLEITASDCKFDYIDVEALFTNSFGIISPNNQKPIDIELTFTAFQAKYIKSLPLHHSQQITKEDTDKVTFSLYIVPTYDFKMELMSYGSSLLDIKPASLKKEIISEHQNTLIVLKN